jgi:hypothetical protein
VRRILLLALFAIAPVAWCQAADDAERSAMKLIDDCSDSAPDDTYGLADLEKACPGLTRALEESGYLPLLSTSARAALHGYDLSDLLQVDYWYRQQEARDVDVDSLAPILASLRAQEPERPLTWFERFKRWLRSMLDRREQESDNWLSRWLDKVDSSQSLARAILNVAIVLIVVLAIAVVFNELRISGMLRKRPGVRDPAMAATAGSGAASSDAADLATLAADRKIPMLLRMLVATLVRSGRLRTERSLTYRELGTRAVFDDAQQRESFRRVAALAERTVYGSGEVPAEEVEPVVAAAHALDEQLRGAST